MRFPKSVLVALALTGPAFAAAPADVPPLRPGLWEATTATASRPQPRPAVTRMCIDRLTQRSVLQQLALALPRMCSRNKYEMRGGRFLTDFYLTVARWVDWATDIVEGWPDDVRDAPFDVGAAREATLLAESINTILRPAHAAEAGRSPAAAPSPPPTS